MLRPSEMHTRSLYSEAILAHATNGVNRRCQLSIGPVLEQRVMAIMLNNTSLSSYHTAYSLRESTLRSMTPRAQRIAYTVTTPRRKQRSSHAVQPCDMRNLENQTSPDYKEPRRNTSNISRTAFNTHQNLHSWLHRTPPPLIAAYPAAYRRLGHEQTNLGWRQLFNGRWSTEWARLQDQYLLQYHDPIPKKLRGQMWTSAHIDILWTSFRALWDSRNGKVHGVDTSTRTEVRQEKIY
jgi:hypothetical protein